MKTKLVLGACAISAMFAFGVSAAIAPPPVSLPSTKAECKDGGWQTYDVFKNQGDCVSFVATDGKNEPSGSVE